MDRLKVEIEIAQLIYDNISPDDRKLTSRTMAAKIMTLITEKEPVATSPAAMTGSAALLREMKDELRGHISEHELDDGDELDTETEDLILGWIDNFFENKIHDMEQEQ